VSLDLSAFVNSSSDLLEEALFGDVPSDVWGQKFKVEFLVTQDNMGFTPNLTIEIRLQVGDDPSIARAKRLIPIKDLLAVSDEVAAYSILGGEVRQAVLSLQTPRVLEHDPRIGMIYTIYGSQSPSKEGWPRMPLCDRVTLTHGAFVAFLNPFRFLNELQRYLQHVETAGHDRGSPHTPIPCPFCGNTDLVRDQYLTPRDVVWAGGNVGWAHSRCASWLEPRVTLI
jgi:hypothetical protein